LNRLPQTFSGPGKRRPGRPGIPAVMDSRRRKKSFTGYRKKLHPAVVMSKKLQAIVMS
jgi:hypothetical protein